MKKSDCQGLDILYEVSFTYLYFPWYDLLFFDCVVANSKEYRQLFKYIFVKWALRVSRSKSIKVARVFQICHIAKKLEIAPLCPSFYWASSRVKIRFCCGSNIWRSPILLCAKHGDYDILFTMTKSKSVRHTAFVIVKYFRTNTNQIKPIYHDIYEVISEAEICTFSMFFLDEVVVSSPEKLSNHRVFLLIILYILPTSYFNNLLFKKKTSCLNERMWTKTRPNYFTSSLFGTEIQKYVRKLFF